MVCSFISTKCIGYFKEIVGFVPPFDIIMEPKENEDVGIIFNNGIPRNKGIREEKQDMNERIQNNTVAQTRASKSDCFQCKICPYNTFRRPFLDKHMHQKHGFSKIKVQKKDEACSYSENMETDIIKNNGEKIEEATKLEDCNSYDGTEFGCELCDFKTRHQNLLNLHLEVHEIEEGEMYQCTQCNFKTEEVSALRDHEKSHKKLTLFSCPNCDYATRQKCNLKAHLKVHQDPEKLERFICETCKKFVSFHYSALLRHIRLKHGTDGKVFKCNNCPYTAKIQRHLTNHQKIHSDHDDVPMFKCEKCDFVTYNEQTIQKHVQRHEEREKIGEEVIVKEQGKEKEIVWFCCNLCDFRSKDQRYVILHKKIHTRIDEINKVGEILVRSAEKNIESSQGSS